MKRKLYIAVIQLLAIVGLSANVFAQQDKLITHFIYDKMGVNPGATAFDKDICGTLLYRNQWDKVSGAPNSIVFNAEANLPKVMGGIGLSFFHDAIGFNKQNNILLNYSYHMSMDEGTLGIGIGIGIVNFGQKPDWIPPVTQNDITLPTGYSAMNMDLNIGLFYRSTQDWYAGLSATHVNEALLRKSETVDNINIDNQYQTKRHVYLIGGKTLRKIGGTNGDLDLQAMVRTELNQFSADINGRYIWNNKYYGGITYRTVDAIGIMLGWYALPNFIVGYSYDITTNKLSSISRGSHEIALRYCHKLPPVPYAVARHPRWL